MNLQAGAVQTQEWFLRLGQDVENRLRNTSTLPMYPSLTGPFTKNTILALGLAGSALDELLTNYTRVRRHFFLSRRVHVHTL